MLLLDDQEDQARDPPARVAEQRRQARLDARARRPGQRISIRVGHYGSTFSKRTGPSRRGTVAMKAGAVMTCDAICPGPGLRSAQRTTVALAFRTDAGDLGGEAAARTAAEEHRHDHVLGEVDRRHRPAGRVLLPQGLELGGGLRHRLLRPIDAAHEIAVERGHWDGCGGCAGATGASVRRSGATGATGAGAVRVRQAHQQQGAGRAAGRSGAGGRAVGRRPSR